MTQRLLNENIFHFNSNQRIFSKLYLANYIDSKVFRSKCHPKISDPTGSY